MILTRTIIIVLFVSVTFSQAANADNNESISASILGNKPSTKVDNPKRSSSKKISKENASSITPSHKHLYEPYNSRRALKLSLNTTLVGVIVGGAFVGLGVGTNVLTITIIGASVGILVLDIGPSTGHFYAGNRLQGWVNTTLRLALSAVFIVGVFKSILPTFDADIPCDESTNRDCNDDDENPHTWPAITIIAATATLGLAIYDIATAPVSARRANKQRSNRKVSAYVVPAAIPSRTGRPAYGIAGLVSF